MKILYTKEFQKNLKFLAKRYQHIRSDIQEIIHKLAEGQVLGVEINSISNDYKLNFDYLYQ